jgi:hypothetical protein
MRSFLILVLAILFFSCVRNKTLPGMQNTVQNTVQTDAKVFTVYEVIQTTNYTYLKVKDNIGEKWVAVTRQDINKGDVYYYDNALQMSNFNSKELNRTFDVIYFVSQISKTPIAQENQGSGMPVHSGKLNAEKSGKIFMAKTGNEITIAQLFSKKTEFAGKEIEIRGIVVKVNPGVMDRNWIHIQDGTGTDEGFDLTVTSQDLAENGDEVTFKGVIAIEKDFGSGYLYDVIMENAVLVKKVPGGKPI